jgi:hypothetical protein
MEDLVFTTPHVYCPDCRHLIDTSIEELADNDEITCPQCSFIFTPNIEVDKFLKLIKEVEKRK